jgi:hypothetical protein
MTYHTDPSRCEAAERSRRLPDEQQLEPPAGMPALFTCRYRGEPAVGAVFRNGAVCVMPDRCTYETGGPCSFGCLRSVEESGQVEDIVWEWGVVRLLGESGTDLRGEP